MKIYTLILFTFLSVQIHAQDTHNTNAMHAITQAVENAYKAISFEDGTTPDYESLRAVFTPQATFINFRTDSMQFLFLDDFIASYKASVESGGLTSFNEIELGGKTEQFGKIGHRISSYGTYINGSEELVERGVNSFQAMEIDGKWLINSVIWDVEKPGQAIPKRYLD